MKIAHVEAGNVVPSIVAPQPDGMYLGRLLEMLPRVTYLGTLLKRIEIDFKTFWRFGSLGY